MGRNNNIEKSTLLGLLLYFFCHSTIAQRVREIIIDKDRVKEYNKNPSIIEETYVVDGIRMYTVDSLKKVVSIATYRENKLDGVAFSFFIDVDMLEEKGEYRVGKKHGTWYYWNRKGELIRTETWKDDKLISKKIMSKSK